MPGGLRVVQRRHRRNKTLPSILGLTGLTHYYAARLTSGYKTGDPVDGLADLVGSNNTAPIGGNNGNRPTWIDNAKQGQPALSWSGSTASMGLVTSTWGAVSQPYTIFAIVKDGGISANGGRIFSGYDGTHRHELFNSSATNYGVYAGTTRTTSFAQDTFNWHIYEILFSGASSSIWQDGTENSPALGNVNTQTSTGIVIGNLGATNDKTFVGMIAEVGMCGGAISVSTRGLLVTYARSVYGI